MTARLTRLRIAGFKSFAEPVSLDILPGLTGIVGPNGCGKSNVVEALRWVMGETSARSLRGGEMDDVIFAGTAARASRNLAEVTVTLEAGAEGAPLPTPFEAEGELQVTRRIERGAGSLFRANGREQRARDVQTLFADLASGARSSGMVSQGRIASLVDARPEERRQVLEEAAGVTGLHARRHEAELKLRAAEQNLVRAEDLRTQLDAAREGLRRQARQAARFRNMSGLVRAAEAEHLAVLHGQASARLAQAGTDLAGAEAALRDAANEARTAAEALAEAEGALPEPRREEAEHRSQLERRRLEAEMLAAEAARLRLAADEAEARLREGESDLAACAAGAADATASVARLAAERDAVASQLAALPACVEAALTAAGQGRAALAARQEDADVSAARAAEAEAARSRAEDRTHVAGEHLALARERHETAEAELAACVAARIESSLLEAAGAALAEAEAGLARSRREAEDADAAAGKARTAAEAGRAACEHERAARSVAERVAQAAALRAGDAESAWAAAGAALATVLADQPGSEAVARAAGQAEAAEAALAEAERALDAAEQGTAAARDAAAAARQAAGETREARRAAQASLSLAEALVARLAAERGAAEEEVDTVRAAAPPSGAVEAAAASHEAAVRGLRAREAAVQALAAAAERADASLSCAREAERAAESDAARLGAEAEGLRATLGEAPHEAGALGGLRVPASLEAAVGAALGEAGEAPLDPQAARHWRMLTPMERPALPSGCDTWLDVLVAAPPALRRALSHVALLGEGGDGVLLQDALPAGTAVVDRHGACWRWDGHVTKAGAPNRAAARLALRRRLEAAANEARAAEAAAKGARDARGAAEAAFARATEAAGAARAEHARALDGARETEAEAERRADAAARAASRLGALDAMLSCLRPELEAAEAEASRAASGLAGLVDGAGFDRVADHADGAVRDAVLAVEAVRAERFAARERAVAARSSAQELAAAQARAEAMGEAGRVTLARATAEWGRARAEAEAAGTALRALPDGPAAQAALARLLVEDAAGKEAVASAGRGAETAQAGLDAARQAETRLRLAHGQAESRLAALSGVAERSAVDLAAAEREDGAAAAALAGLPDAAVLGEAAQAARRALEAARQAAGQADAALSDLRAEAAHAQRALAGLSAEWDAWRRRREEAAGREAGLRTRVEAARSACSALAAAPGEVAARAARSGEALAAAERAHGAALGRLTAAEGRARALLAAERDAVRQEAACRDRQTRAEAARDACGGALEAVLARAAERLGASALSGEVADLSEAAEERARRKVDRLARERDEMGPVNLCAEGELEVLEERIGTLETERAEIGTAIAKLRGAIGHLNREGRERLATVFTEVDRHFRALFTRTVGGGRAHLALVGSEDPLEAGLEIYAEPPGKKLASLSLLSGGEQALTALSLIFAVFRCTPAPVCVLDEVDAPLDDANVDRFCRLLDEMVRETGTSFLVVTHHQLTMARMDRLYGVTMQERGVSRLLSVDLARAAAMAGPVLQAAAE